MRSSRTRLPSFLAELRRRRGLLQATLAERLGVQQSTVSESESGERTISATRLASWLDVLAATDEERLAALHAATESADESDALPAA